MDIHHLRVFVSVFRNRSFSRASAELHLSQPTVSDHIKALEEELECRLFDRLGRTIVATKEAELLSDHAIEIIEKTAALKEIVGRFKQEVKGELIVGASTIPGTYLIPPLMAGFQNTYPLIAFQVHISDSGNIVESILSHKLLVGIVGVKLANPGLNYTPLLEDELLIVSSPALIKQNTITLAELRRFPMVLREQGSGTRKVVERILEENGLSPASLAIAGIFGSTDAVKEAVKAGLGISVLSRLSVADELKYRTLKGIKLMNIPMKRNFYVVTHRKRTLPLAYRTFLEYLKFHL